MSTVFSRRLRLLTAGALVASALTASVLPASAEDAAAAQAPAADTAKPMKAKKRAKPVASLEQRHAVCLAFIRRHDLSCDPWQEPTCGAETGYFRPAECVRPRSQ